jgi:hypothetical protein
VNFKSGDKTAICQYKRILRSKSYCTVCAYSLPPSAAANQADGFDIQLNQTRGHRVVLIPTPVIENIHRKFRPTEMSKMEWDIFIKEHAG